jgi:hypothetical protein
MESEHHSKNINFAKPCAEKAGIDYGQIEACASSERSGKVMQYIAEQSTNAKVQYYPDIRVNGAETQGDYTTVKGLVKIICDGYNGDKKPAACDE